MNIPERSQMRFVLTNRLEQLRQEDANQNPR